MTISHTPARALALFALALAAGPAQAQDPMAGKAVFQSTCGICHSVAPAHNGIGPSLFGIVGRKASRAPGYAYSDANKASGLTFDPATLDRYLTAPMTVVPNTKMTYAGLKDPDKRASLIAYLATVH